METKREGETDKITNTVRERQRKKLINVKSSVK